MPAARSPYPIDSPYYTTVAGEFQNSESPYGTFDQGGNLWEWNEAIVSDLNRGLRGGSFDNSVNYLLASNRDSYYPSYECYYVGFRVAEVPEPAPLAMMGVAGLGLLLRKRR